MKIGIDNWRWSGVPFYIRTGKQMPTKVTEIVVHFRETPHQMFHCHGGHCPRANKLILRLQPNEGIVLKFGMKVPGPGFDVKQVMMDFSYDQLGGRATGDAYARLIEDCIQGDPTLFTRSDAVRAPGVSLILCCAIGMNILTRLSTVILSEPGGRWKVKL